MIDVADVPEVVQAKARVAGADDWLHHLPATVAALGGEWGFTTGRVFTEGTEAFVVEADLADGTPAVLKLLVPRSGDAARHEITVLRLAGGDGCVRLLAADEAVGALLLERLGPSMHSLGLPFEQRLPLLVDAARRVWRPAPAVDLPTGADKAAWLAAEIPRMWEATGRACTDRAVEHALGCAKRRLAAHRSARAVLVHGDVHQWNALRAADGSFKLVDPDGLLAEPEYDLGILMREDPVELLDGDPRERAMLLAEWTGLDPLAIWEWGVVERVSTGLICTQVGLQPVGAQMLAAAHLVATMS